MNTDNSADWMLSPKSLIGLLGAEYGLMRDGGVLKRFYISALSIIVILLLTGASILYAIHLLFRSLVVEIGLASFFCALFVCIYIFLLNTFAKEHTGKHPMLSASNIIRSGFIAFMALLIAQPIMIMLFASRLSNEVDHYKLSLLHAHTRKIENLSQKEIAALSTNLQYFIHQRQQYATHLYDNDIDQIKRSINTMQQKATAARLKAQQTIEKNAFFLYQVEKVNHGHPLVWLLTLLIILLFLLPGYLIFSISHQHEYYQLKKMQEKKLVTDAYDTFKTHYHVIFEGKVSIFSRYTDPPFNKTRKQSPASATTQEFLAKYQNTRPL